MAEVQKIATGSTKVPGTGTLVITSTGAATSTANSIVVRIAVNKFGVAGLTFAVTDSALNTYVKDIEQTQGPNNISLATFRANASTGAFASLPNGGTITLTQTGGNIQAAAATAYEFQGNLAVVAVGGTNGQSNGATSVVDSGMANTQSGIADHYLVRSTASLNNAAVIVGYHVTGFADLLVGAACYLDTNTRTITQPIGAGGWTVDDTNIGTTGGANNTNVALHDAFIIPLSNPAGPGGFHPGKGPTNARFYAPYRWDVPIAVGPTNPFKHSAGYLVIGGSKRLRRRASALYSLETTVRPQLTDPVPPTQPAASFRQTGTARPARRRVGFWHTIAQAVNTAWTAALAPVTPPGEALIVAGSRRLRRRASSSLGVASQTNAQLVSDAQINLAGEARWRVVTTVPARPNPPNLLLFILTIVGIPFKHSAGYLVQVFRWGRRWTRRMLYWPFFQTPVRPLFTDPVPETKPGLVMVQAARRRPRRRQGYAHGLGNQVNTIYTAVAAPQSPAGEALVTANAQRLRRRATSSVTAHQNTTTILQ